MKSYKKKFKYEYPLKIVQLFVATRCDSFHCSVLWCGVVCTLEGVSLTLTLVRSDTSVTIVIYHKGEECK